MAENMTEREPNQKQELLLNLALEATEEELTQSGILSGGIDEEGQWEVIVRYHGDPGQLLVSQTTRVEPLWGGYAIVWTEKDKIPVLSALPQVEYVELPKPVYDEIQMEKDVSCISSLQREPESSAGLPEGEQERLEELSKERTVVYGENSDPLYGQGILLAIIDSGIDYTMPEFLYADGSSKILRLWDQSLDQVFTREEINEALTQTEGRNFYEAVPSRDVSGHGTRVAAIATAVAPLSDLLIVKMGIPKGRSFPRTTELMRGINQVVSFAREINRPVAVNISFGNNYGSHDGASLLETFMNELAGSYPCNLIVGSGNEGAEAGHCSGILQNPVPGKNVYKEILWSIGPFESMFQIQLWKTYADDFDITLIAPDGTEVPMFTQGDFMNRYELGGAKILAYRGLPTPYSSSQEIFLDFLPRDLYLPSGIWRLRLIPKIIVDGRYHCWLPVAGSFNRGTRFLEPDPGVTLTIPSTAYRAITVGAYDARTNSYADFSGRGYLRNLDVIKPDLVAPGVNVQIPFQRGTVSVTGTSFATPFVTGSAALMMEWGMVKGNDPFLYGEKLKAYLQNGAKAVGVGQRKTPNPRTGFGALCVRNSIPGL
jgi:subtilisin family serine protease